MTDNINYHCLTAIADENGILSIPDDYKIVSGFVHLLENQVYFIIVKRIPDIKKVIEERMEAGGAPESEVLTSEVLTSEVLTSEVLTDGE